MNINLTSREVLIMKCIWSKQKDLTLPEIIVMLESRFQWVAKRSTVRTFLTDMEKKGYIKFERRGKYSYITSLVEENIYREQQAESMVNFWFDGSKGNLIKTLTKDISDEEKDYLKSVLDELNEDK